MFNTTPLNEDLHRQFDEVDAMFLLAIIAQRGHRIPKWRLQKLRALFRLTAVDRRRISMQLALAHSPRRLLEDRNLKLRLILRQTIAAVGSSPCASLRNAMRNGLTPAQLHAVQREIWCAPPLDAYGRLPYMYKFTAVTLPIFRSRTRETAC